MVNKNGVLILIGVATLSIIGNFVVLPVLETARAESILKKFRLPDLPAEADVVYANKTEGDVFQLHVAVGFRASSDEVLRWYTDCQQWEKSEVPGDVISFSFRKWPEGDGVDFVGTISRK